MDTVVLTPDSTPMDSFFPFWDVRDFSCSLTPDKQCFDDQICPLLPSLDHNKKGILNDDSFAHAFAFSPPRLKTSPRTSGQNLKFPLCGLSPNLNPPATISLSPKIKPIPALPPLILPEIDDIGIVTPIKKVTKNRKRKSNFIETPQRKRMKMIGSELRYSCRDCGLKCKKIKNLQELQQLYPEYGNSFYCDECEKNSPSWPMFHCTQPTCEYDVCMSCAWKDFDAGIDDVVTPTNDRADMRLNLVDEDEHFKIKEPATTKIETPKGSPQKKKPNVGFRLIFARPGVNPIGFCPRFEQKKSKKSGRTRSFDHVKQALLTNQPSGRGKGQKPPVDSVKGEFFPPSQGKFAKMKRFEKLFFWKSRKQWLAYWPCFEAAFDEFELARLHMVFMEERETESIETSARGRIVKKKHIRPAKVSEEMEKEFHKRYAKANPELALILLRVYRLWTGKRHIFAARPWIDHKKKNKTKQNRSHYSNTSCNRTF